MKRKYIWIATGIFILLLMIISTASFIYINSRSSSDASDIPLIVKIFSPVSYFMSSPPKMYVFNNTNRIE